ncbi:FMN-binding negative transcriptional regulator [Sulfobacillus sp. hq2]|uniref:FMN-binding negative transcriptional regulator n=1 Tax=Sulfobacillus TaxID=28033 RepID=UPI000CD1FD4D|nr:FMN-binding negative transcriptional regulator [Sulfobacillus sp. hq2]POB10639.1 transcriptional regulator [Sulfobacillus sp. hq2]
MYIPKAFQLPPSELANILWQYPFGVLTSVQGQDVVATHLPLLYRDGENPQLLGHLARANSHWQGLAGASVLAIFSGPDGYISPEWYGEEFSVPTWNYVAIHIRGTCEIVDQAPGIADILQALLKRFEPQTKALWEEKLTRAPYVQMLEEIVGVRIHITSVEGKAKLGQNRSVASRIGAILGLRRTNEPVNHRLAALMEETLGPDDPLES